MPGLVKRVSSQSAARRRRAIALLLIAVTLVAGVWTVIGAATSAVPANVQSEHRQVTLFIGGRQVATYLLEDYSSVDGAVDAGRLMRAVVRVLPARGVTKTAYAKVAVRYQRTLTARRVLSKLQGAGGKVIATRRPIASVIDVPVRQQSMRNNCEAAAMSTLLEAVGVKIDQDRLQARFPRSGPLDPQGSGTARIWGDPEVGYVGRADGGGVAGGFGIYPPPLVRLGHDLGVKMKNLTGVSAETIYDRLLAGLPVMVWIGLSDGPYGQWRSPEGRAVNVNFGEHTVVLSGLDRDGTVRVSNPLQGTSERWTPTEFMALWQRLGRRALGPAA